MMRIIEAASRIQSVFLNKKFRWKSKTLYATTNVESPNLKPSDKTISQSISAIYKLFDSLGARYLTNYTSFDASLIGIPADKVFDLIKQLSFVESKGIYPITFKVYGDKVIRKDFYSFCSSSDSKDIASKLKGKPSFYLQILHVDPNGTLSSLISKEIIPLSFGWGGVYSHKLLEHISSTKIHKSDIDNVFQRLNFENNILTLDSYQDIIENPVDVVITWVNKDDSKWQGLWHETFGCDEGSNRALESDRFTCSDEIMYCLRSINTHLNWVRKIHILSNCEPPSWLNTSHPRINWVDHTDIIDEKYLPTFNSHAIESSLHKIPGLSEKYLYFNDDFIITKPTHITHFFDPFMRPLMNCENYAIVRPSYLKVVNKDYMIASVNAYNLLSNLDLDNVLPDALNLHCHLPYAFDKSIVNEFEDEAPHSFEVTRSARLRSNTDLNFASFACHWYGYAKGKVTKNPLRSKIDYAIVRPKNLESLMNSSSVPRFLCFNDGDSTSSMRSYKYSCDLFLRSLLPCKSFAER